MKKLVGLVYFGLISSSVVLSQTDKKVIAFNQSIEQEKNSDYLSALQTVMDLKDSTSYEINMRLGWLYYKSGDKKKSMYYSDKAINIKPNAIEPRYGYGFPAYQLADYKDLIEQDKKILEIDPNNKTVNGNLGSIYYYAKEYNKALPYFQKVVSLYPFDYDNNLMLAWTYLRLEKNMEAEQTFNIVLLYSPKDPSANEGLLTIKKSATASAAILAAFTKSYELSEKADYKGAMSPLKEVYDKTSYVMNLRLGWLCYLAGMQTESTTYYKIASELKPNAIEPKFGCSFPAEVLGNKNELKSHYESILTIDPQNTSAHYKMGVLEYGKKDYNAAIKHFEKVVTLYPCDTDGLLMLGWTNFQLGKLTEAHQFFNKVLCLSPNNASALQGLASKPVDPNKKTGF